MNFFIIFHYFLSLSNKNKKADKPSWLTTFSECYKIDTRLNAGIRLQNKKTCGRELLTAGLAEKEGFEPSRRLPDLLPSRGTQEGLKCAVYGMPRRNRISIFSPIK